jgi:ATP-dependent Lon protease
MNQDDHALQRKEEVTLDDQLKCVRRELALRQRVYPKHVFAGKMKQEAADYELAAMQAVHDTLKKLRDAHDQVPA